MQNKGFVGILLVALGVIVIAGSVVSLAMTMQEEAEFNIQKRQLEIEQLERQIDIGTGVSPGVGLYSYENIKPYINFFFEDLTGTARNPTLYLYKDDPTTLSGGEYWGFERSWTDSADEYWSTSTASSGKVQKQMDIGLKVWAHASLGTYEDIFFEYTVPTRGDVEPSAAVDTNAGLTAGTFVMARYGINALATSIDLGHDAANHTNTELSKSVTSIIVGDNNRTCLSEMKLTNIGKKADLGVRKVTVDIKGKEFLIYDDSGGIDRTKYFDATDLQTYDSDDYSTHRNTLNTICWEENELPSILIHVWADTRTDSTWATGYLSNGNETMKMTVNDREGTALINDVSVTA